MSKVDIDIRLDGGQQGYVFPKFLPGEQVKGTVTVYPNSSINCRQLLIQLMWYTDGRGTRFEKIEQEDKRFEGELQAGMPQSYDFNFTLPQEPWSYEGHYVSIVWGVRLKIDVPRRKDVLEMSNFIVEPNRETAVDNW